MNILVTGGAGYIGSLTVRKLLESGHRVTVFDVLENGHRQAVDRRARLIVGDLRQKEPVAALFKNNAFESVIHFAGSIESGQSMTEPLKFFENNFGAGVNLLQSLSEVGLKRIIFSSTAGIYGTGQPPFTEESPASPTSYYSLSKYFFEQALKAESLAHNFQVVVLRYFNAAGAAGDGSLGEAHEPETHLLPLLVETALGRIPEFNLYGTDYPTADGTAIRDYIHVEDLAEAHLTALQKFNSAEPDRGFLEIYNVGAGRGHSNLEVIDLVKKISGRDFRVVPKPRRAGDWAESFADVSKIERQLGFRARRSLKEIVESAYLWHARHPYGFSSK